MSWLTQRMQKLMFWRDAPTDGEFEITDCWPDLPDGSAASDTADHSDHDHN